MQFNSFTFILFFAGVLLLHNLPLPWRVKKFNLLWVSYLFYAAWNPPFVILLWISTVADWFIAKRLDRTEGLAKRRLWLVASLGVNLGLLGYFKYGGFLLKNFVVLLGALGIDFHPAAPDIILPVGISFYTFQTLSYTLDIYRRKMRPWHSFLDYAMYVTFFPQLVAGPIVRAADFLPQCETPRRPTGRQFGWGLWLLVLGLFEKMVVADGLLAPVVERVYDSPGTPGFVAAWCGTFAFAGQIFCDFAGYSTCAIGVAMCLGFRIPDNFRFPYAAIGFADFWRRWHISLSSWLRDYLYIPLGGNRKGRPRTYVNLMVTMLLGGLWHGASWTFVAWGGLHGLYLLVERILRHFLQHARVWRRPPVRLALGLMTFLLVCIAWVFFRANTFERAFTIASVMLGRGGLSPDLYVGKIMLGKTLLTVGVLLAVHWRLRSSSLEALVEKTPWWVRSAALAAMLILMATMPGEDRAFIYFQF